MNSIILLIVIILSGCNQSENKMTKNAENVSKKMPYAIVIHGGAGTIDKKNMDNGALFPLRDDAALAELLVAHAGFTNETRKAVAERALLHLHAHFSDEAARRRFFALPMVRAVLGDVIGS